MTSHIESQVVASKWARQPLRLPTFYLRCRAVLSHLVFHIALSLSLSCHAHFLGRIAVNPEFPVQGNSVFPAKFRFIHTQSLPFSLLLLRFYSLFVPNQEGLRVRMEDQIPIPQYDRDTPESVAKSPSKPAEGAKSRTSEVRLEEWSAP